MAVSVDQDWLDAQEELALEEAYQMMSVIFEEHIIRGEN